MPSGTLYEYPSCKTRGQQNLYVSPEKIYKKIRKIHPANEESYSEIFIFLLTIDLTGLAC